MPFSRPRFLDDAARVVNGAASALSGLAEEARTQVRGRRDRLIERLSLVRRDELEVLRDLLAATRADTERLTRDLEALRAAGGHGATATPAAPSAP